VNFKEPSDAHRRSKEFSWCLANVAAAETCWPKKTPLLYRNSRRTLALPSLEHLRETAQAAGYTLARGKVLHHPPAF